MRFRVCVNILALAFQAAVLSFGVGLSGSATATEEKPPIAGAVAADGKPQPSDWPMYGRDLAGSHYNPTEKAITPATVARLKPKWVFETEGDVSSQPTVVNGVVYFGSWDGKQYAVDAKTGKQIWAYDIGSPSRSGAAYAEGALFFGDIAGRLYALDAKTGALKWKVKIDPHPTTVATSSPIYYNGRVYIGVSSHEEGAILGNPKYECCTFRGGVAAYDAKTGAQVWRWYTIPETPTPQGKDKKGATMIGPAGGAVWSTISIHPSANRVYVTTGNQYTPPASKFPNAIVALELGTGKVVWSYQATPKDIWNFDCRNLPDCSDLDVDFGSTALVFKGPGGKQLVGAGQKSGWFWALDPKNGTVVWKTEVGPGGKLGGIEFGDATDGERVYVGVSAFPKQGSVAALDGATGKILWKTLAPDKGANFGPITVTGTGDNRLVFAGTNKNFIRAYDAKDGTTLWEFDTGGAVGGGPTVADGVLYVGSGYQFLRIGKPNKKLYAFSIDGK
ncbi:MAG TPA: PQQ-binding-like beta-propeller repeat protein [Blastocatellia bacterium]|nr:PQQ-binding-like beta-propeller repeat protein [Blastocatellia bacterium]